MRVPDWGLPKVKRGTGGCNSTILDAEGVIGYIVKRALASAATRILWASSVWDQDWGLPRGKHGIVGCNSTNLVAGGGIGYIVKRAKRAQRRESCAIIDISTIQSLRHLVYDTPKKKKAFQNLSFPSHNLNLKILKGSLKILDKKIENYSKFNIFSKNFLVEIIFSKKNDKNFSPFVF